MLTFRIEGMSCGHCVKHVQQAIAQVPGVQGLVEVSLERREAKVAGTPEPAAVVAAVQEEGYTATLLP
ncbi:MAG TPA: heavy metal-associated domain-containing protein [Holophaga sp.]|nr:heavy metal-associated domain-containing protein [Holophaga sp.]